MARISGIDIPREKRVEIALTYIYGIGLPTSQKILAQANVNPDTRVRDLTEDQVNRLREIIDRRYKVEGDLRREVALNIKRLQEIGSYRGLRHRRNLPVARPAHQDQRTPAARTASGPSASGARSKGAAAARRWPRTQERADEDAAARREEERAGRATRTSRRASTTRSSRITDLAGGDGLVGQRRRGRLQGLAQEHALCRRAVR